MSLSKPTIGKLLVVAAFGVALLMSQGRAFADGGGPHGPKLIHTEAVGQVAITGFAFGGPAGCNTSTGAGCSFYNLTGTVAGQSVPFGPYNAAVTATVLFGSPAPSGAHDGDGNPIGFCSPEVGTEVDTFSDGSTLTSDFQGTSCCAATTCPPGAPLVNHDSSVVTGGTGKLTGASGGTSWSDNSSGSGPLTLHAEGVLSLPGGSH
jgi:hypothetical protein